MGDRGGARGGSAGAARAGWVIGAAGEHWGARGKAAKAGGDGRTGLGRSSVGEAAVMLSHSVLMATSAFEASARDPKRYLKKAFSMYEFGT